MNPGLASDILRLLQRWGLFYAGSVVFYKKRIPPWMKGCDRPEESKEILYV